MAKRKPVPASLTTTGNLMMVARKLAAKQRRRRELLKMLKVVDAEIRQAKRELKALATKMSRDEEQSPPMRIFGES